MATIKIYSRYIESSIGRHVGDVLYGDSGIPEHLYLVYTDDAGNKRIIRAGPEENGLLSDPQGPVLGNVNAIEGSFNDLSSDWYDPDTDPAPHVTTITPLASGSDADIAQVWDLMKTKALSITVEQYDYGTMSQNSNTVIHYVVQNADFLMDPMLRASTNWTGFLLPQRNNEDVLAPAVFSAFSHAPISHDEVSAQLSLQYYHKLSQGLFNQIALPLSFAIADIVDDLRLAMASSSIIYGDPVIFDLNSDGITLSAMTSSHAYFSLNGNGFLNRTGWVSGGDGLLAIDANNDGKINDINELFGSVAQSGFAELATLDSNADNKITAADAQWGALKIWVDSDSDGNTDAGELKTLAELNITEIGLTATTVNQNINGNTLVETANFVMNGTNHVAGEVLFNLDPTNTIYDI